MEHHGESGRQEIFGYSTNGVPLVVVLPDHSPSSTLVLAGQHGHEAEGVTLLSYALRQVDRSRLRVAVVLCANPDGLLQGTRGNARRVDLNRNFPTTCWQRGEISYPWTSEDLGGTGWHSGSVAGSESETQALIELIERRQLSDIYSIHAPLGLIAASQPSSKDFALAKQMQMPLVEDVSYAAPGSLCAWAAESGRRSVLIELSEVGLWQSYQKWSEAVVEILTQ